LATFLRARSSLVALVLTRHDFVRSGDKETFEKSHRRLTPKSGGTIKSSAFSTSPQIVNVLLYLGTSIVKVRQSRYRPGVAQRVPGN